jgi:hypothetical protein
MPTAKVRRIQPAAVESDIRRPKQEFGSEVFDQDFHTSVGMTDDYLVGPVTTHDQPAI